ncbi:MAG: phosphatidylserine decarboxylase [Pseudonocardiaceae bacterium]|nr:phosphatidylserine decarboxylase [Pseudonocardiaceae bacterium]
MPSPRHLLALARDTIPPMHPAGRPYVVGGAITSLLARRVSPGIGMACALATACCAWFFREPRRVPPQRDGVVVAAADGLVSSTADAPPPEELGFGETSLPRVSVFLSVFDVHVQRIPLDGEVVRIVYRPGTFVSADLDKASEVNERNSMLLRGRHGDELAVVQIAGLIARRIVCSVQSGDPVRVGDTYGLIRFGSRVDVYLPAGSEVLVRPGQRTIGGETVLAQLPVGSG